MSETCKVKCMHRKKRLGKYPIPFPSLATYDTAMICHGALKNYPVYVRLTFLSSFHRHHFANVSCSSTYAYTYTHAHIYKNYFVNYLLYKGEKPSVYLSVCLSVGTFSGTHFAPSFQRGSTPHILDMKRPSLQVTISLFKRF